LSLKTDFRNKSEEPIKWTEMVKLKDKQVGQNFIELKHMTVVILLNYLKTKEMLKNCEAK